MKFEIITYSRSTGDPSYFDIDAGGAIRDDVMIKIPRKGENNG